MVTTVTPKISPYANDHSVLPEQEALLEVRDLVKTYSTDAGDFPALKGISYQVEPGEFVVVVGKSGAGKSTMINMVTGIDSPNSGEIYFRGQPLHTFKEDQLARWRGNNLGIIFKDEGDVSSAEKYYRKALELQPACHLIEVMAQLRNLVIAVVFDHPHVKVP